MTTAPVGPADVAVSLALKGLKGGHSGCEIHVQRGNAVKLLARAVWTASLGTSFRLAAFKGGSAHNAIPREAFAVVVVAPDAKDGLLSALRAEVDEIQAEVPSGRSGNDLRGGDIGDVGCGRGIMRRPKPCSA